MKGRRTVGHHLPLTVSYPPLHLTDEEAAWDGGGQEGIIFSGTQSWNLTKLGFKPRYDFRASASSSKARSDLL